MRFSDPQPYRVASSSAGGAPPGLAGGGASKWSKVLEHGVVRRASTLQGEVDRVYLRTPAETYVIDGDCAGQTM